MISIARLHLLLDYDPLTGLFRWKNPQPRQAVGWFKGNKSVRQYRRLYIYGQHYLAHRVAWAWMTGTWPKEIDHRDRNQANNVWSNLRAATHSENGFNRGIAKNNTTGVTGVSRFGQKFRATIRINGKQVSLGIHPTVELAAQARVKALLI